MFYLLKYILLRFVLSHVAAHLSFEAVVKGFPGKELHLILLIAYMIFSYSRWDGTNTALIAFQCGM